MPGSTQDAQISGTVEGLDYAYSGLDNEPNQNPEPLNNRLQLKTLPGSTDTAASFEFTHEDHTLGNALRHIIMKNPDVEFCGYTIPHPAEPKMNLRIQTYDNVSVYDVLKRGLEDLMDLCDVVLDKFTAAKADFEQNKMSS